MRYDIKKNIDYIEVSDDYISVEDFLNMIRGCNNVKRLANLGYQAGCPIYLIEFDEGFDIIWHPNKDQSKNSVDIKVTESNNMEIFYGGIKQPLGTLEDIKEHIIFKSLIGENPFRENTLVYERGVNKNKGNFVKGYKVFNPDWTCKGFKYELGEIYEYEGEIELCRSGFHFCKKVNDCFYSYRFDSNNKVAEVEALGFIKSSDGKSVTNKIKIVRELTWHEVLELVNTGKNCTGVGNSGDENSGYENSGHRNSGHYNSGNRNSGHMNSGHMNSGNKNSGDLNVGFENNGNKNSGSCNSGDLNVGYRNRGDYNSGSCNSGNKNSGNKNSGNGNSGNGNNGNRNSGDWSIGDYNNGVFCTGEPTIKIFDIETNMTFREWRRTKASNILTGNFELNVWISKENMSVEEKRQYPKYDTLGGYLKTVSYQEAWKNMWNILTAKEKQEIMNIPNFNASKFRDITGIQI